MVCDYTLPLVRPAQAKVQILTTSSYIVKWIPWNLVNLCQLYLPFVTWPTVDFLLTPPPLFVHVIIEWPLMMAIQESFTPNFHEIIDKNSCSLPLYLHAFEA